MSRPAIIPDEYSTEIEQVGMYRMPSGVDDSVVFARDVAVRGDGLVVGVHCADLRAVLGLLHHHMNPIVGRCHRQPAATTRQNTA